MSAADALREARTAGIGLRVEGCDLALEADTPPPAGLLERLARHKPEIVALLRPGLGGSSGEDWQAHFDERAGIQHSAQFRVAVAVDLAQIGTDRIDDDEANVADPNDRLLQELQVALEVEAAMSLVVAGMDSRDDVDLVGVGAGGIVKDAAEVVKDAGEAVKDAGAAVVDTVTDAVK